MVAQPDNDLVFQGIGNRGVRNLLGHDLLDALEARLGLGGGGTRQHELAVDLGDLLIVHQPTAGVDDVVLGLEIEHGPLGGRGVRAQLADAVLQPNAGTLGGLVLHLELVDHIGLGDGVRDLRGALGVERRETDLDRISEAHAPDRAALLEHGQWPARELELAARLGAEPGRDRLRQGADEPAIAVGKLGIADEIELLDDGGRDVLRLQHLDLRLDRSGIDRQVANHRLLLQQGLLAAVDDQHRLGGEARRCDDEVDDAERERQADDHEHDRILPAQQRDKRSERVRWGVLRRDIAGGVERTLTDLEHLTALVDLRHPDVAADLERTARAYGHGLTLPESVLVGSRLNVLPVEEVPVTDDV